MTVYIPYKGYNDRKEGIKIFRNVGSDNLDSNEWRRYAEISVSNRR